MDNPARTAEHVARIAKRRSDLRSQLAQLITQPIAIVWEIGCGHGHFLTAYAAAHPDEFCIGVDICLDRIRRGNRKRDRAKLTNLHFIHADARDFLDALPNESSLSIIFILFPDPWPKRRHHKNRILQSDFLTAVGKRARPGVRLHFRTDHEPYFRDSEFAIREHLDWQILPEPWPFEQATVFQSLASRHYSLTAGRRVGDK